MKPSTDRYTACEDRIKTRAALAMSENIDWGVGRVLDRLDELGLTEETIVLYFSDNGPNGWRWNANMRGRKGSTDEGGVWVPMVIRWPGTIAAGMEISEIAGAIDLLPTLVDLAGISVQGEKPLDGRSLRPLLLEENENWPRRRLFAHWAGEISARTPQFRLDSEGRLYDITEDPEQRRDVADKRPEVAERLREAIEEWDRTVRAEHDEKDRPFPVGYPEFPLTRLPARDGVAHGTIERSNRFPNASFFRHWTSVEDSVTWDVRVETPGRYRVTVYYTLAEEDVGAEMNVRFKGRAVERTITRAHDPPLVGKQHDRIPRQESYVKRFRPVEFGAIDLPEGRGPLTLQASHIPGDRAIDVRWVELDLLEEATPED